MSGVTERPLVRAVVYETGTLNQTVTDDEGRFTLEATTRDPRLLVQSLGYREQEAVPHADGAPLDIVMAALWDEDALRSTTGQQWDPDFEIDIGAPTYSVDDAPTVHVDEGHHNFHTATGRYRTFADVLAQDGINVVQFQQAFSEEALAGVDVLVIATPIDGMETGSLSDRSPFKPQEVANLHAWVESGGALLIICDHLPIPGALAPVLEGFGVQGDNGYAMHFYEDGSFENTIVFRRMDGSLAPHPIIDGLDAEERIDSVATFTGFAFRAPESFRPLMIFGENAWSLNPSGWFNLDRNAPRIPVAGWYHGAAAEVGHGRLVLIGEAAMFTAQVRGPDRYANGLSSPEAVQNAQFLLNIMHWLAGTLDG